MGHQIQNWRISDTTKGTNVLHKGFQKVTNYMAPPTLTNLNFAILDALENFQHFAHFQWKAPSPHSPLQSLTPTPLLLMSPRSITFSVIGSLRQYPLFWKFQESSHPSHPHTHGHPWPPKLRLQHFWDLRQFHQLSPLKYPISHSILCIVAITFNRIGQHNHRSDLFCHISLTSHCSYHYMINVISHRMLWSAMWECYPR